MISHIQVVPCFIELYHPARHCCTSPTLRLCRHISRMQCVLHRLSGRTRHTRFLLYPQVQPFRKDPSATGWRQWIVPFLRGSSALAYLQIVLCNIVVQILYEQLDRIVSSTSLKSSVAEASAADSWAGTKSGLYAAIVVKHVMFPLLIGCSGLLIVLVKSCNV